MPGTLIVDDARRDDLVLALRSLSLDGERVAGHRHAAHGRHAVREPQLVGVLGLVVLRRAAGVNVHVDEARHTYMPVASISWSALRRAASAASARPASRRCDRGDAVAFDDDVHRPAAVAPGAVDEHHAADHQRLERAAPFVRTPIRRRLQCPFAHRRPRGLLRRRPRYRWRKKPRTQR